jgi:hypothetical protein
MTRPLLILALEACIIAGCGDDEPSLVSTLVEHRHVTVSEDTTGATDTAAPGDTATAGDGATQDDTGAPVDTSVATDSGPGETRDTGDTGDTADTANPPEDTVETTSPPEDTADTSTPPDDTTTEPGDAGPTRYPEDRIHSPLTPAVVRRLQGIRAVDPALAEDVFMKVGASTTVSSSNLKCLATASVDFGEHGYLQDIRDYYLDGDADGSDPFSRSTLAAKSGVSAVWAISGNPSPLEQEYLAIEPAYAIVHYGTNDMQLGSSYQSALWGFGQNLWTLIDELLSWGVIPILATISHRLDSAGADAWVPTYNAVIRGIAQGRQVPLVDMWLAFEPLPNHGVSGDGIHGSVYGQGACYLTEAGLRYGLNMRNLQTLTALQRITAATLDGEVFDSAGPGRAGVGTLDDPLLIDAVPFSDMRSTADSGSRAFDLYTGCGSSADESGPERIYRFDVAQPMRVRAFVHGRFDDVDIDVHLLDQSATEAGCIQRAHRMVEADLVPGTYYFVLDSFVDDGVELSGEYLFNVLRIN